MPDAAPFQLSFPVSEVDRNLGPVEASSAHHPSARKKDLGAFYTPQPLARALAEWAVRSPTDTVLDPSFGGLAFLDTAAERLQALGLPEEAVGDQLWGVDLDPAALASAQLTSDLGIPSSNLIEADFFAVGPDEVPHVDVLLGNPPYIRYQGFNGSGSRARETAAAAGVKLTKLASSWAAFVVHGASFLRPGGRMAQVLPAELLHAQYAGEVVEFLRRSFGRVAVVVFEERVFPGALEDVVLLLADDYGAPTEVAVQLVPFVGVEDLDLAALNAASGVSISPQTGGHKLIAQLLPEETQRLLTTLGKRDDVCRLGELASVDIGIVSGANSFFMLDRQGAAAVPTELLRPAVSKAMHLAGARLTNDDHERMLDQGLSGLMFVANESSPREALEAASAHIEAAEEEGLDGRYKCRIREPWWALPVPKQGPPDLLLTYCSSAYPRIAVNELSALHTNTLHAVRVTDGTEPTALAVAFYNSLTMLSVEVSGRSYGGGVLKLEPTEAEQLLLPRIKGSLAALLPEVDAAVRLRDIEAAMDLVDRVLLVEGLGLPAQQVAALRAGATQLRARRVTRGHSPRA